MRHLDKYGDFVNENIFKKWFGTSDEEKRKMGYVENDEGKLVHPDDAKKIEQSQKDKIVELKKLVEEKYKDFNIKWLLYRDDDLSFEFNSKKDIDDLIPTKGFKYDSKEYSLNDLIKSISFKITLHLNSKSSWKSKGIVRYVQITQKMELSDNVNFVDCYLNTHDHSDARIRGKDNKFYLYFTKFVEINYDLVDNDIIERWKSGSFIEYTIKEQYKINTRLLIETIKKSFDRRKELIKDEEIKNNIDYIKECFYDIIDFSDSSNIEEKNGDVTCIFEIKGINVISQSESVYVGSYRSRGNATFNKAKFELNDKTIDILSMLSESTKRLNDKIPNCSIQVEMENNYLKLNIS